MENTHRRQNKDAFSPAGYSNQTKTPEISRVLTVLGSEEKENLPRLFMQDVQDVHVRHGDQTRIGVSTKVTLSSIFAGFDKRLEEQAAANDRRFKEQAAANDRRFKEQEEANDRRFKEQEEANDRRFKEQAAANNRRFKEQEEEINRLRVEIQHLQERLDDSAKVYNENVATIRTLRDSITKLNNENLETLRTLRARIAALEMDQDEIEDFQNRLDRAMCPLCTQSPKMVALRMCGHAFCSPCLESAPFYSLHCPICRRAIPDDGHLLLN